MTAKEIQRDLESTLILDIDSEEEQAVEPISTIPESIEEITKHPDSNDKDEDMNDKETIYISNAGLVLLNPFIPVLFERAGLSSNSTFISADKQERAVHLLQYFVGFQENNPEYLLTLPKILSGFDIETPIQKQLELTKSEKELAGSLIASILQQWEILGETTVEGFQQSFLSRNGALYFLNDHWELEVEGRSFDMLIDKLPWTFSLINYHWMEAALYTKWR